MKKGYLEGTRVKGKLIALLAEGVEPTEAAQKMSTRRTLVTQQAVSAFKKRHLAEVEAKKAELAAQVIEEHADLWIASKHARNEKRQKLIEQCEFDLVQIDELLKSRGSLEVEEPRWVGPAEGGKEYKLRKFDAPLMAERNRLRKRISELMTEAAEELGDIPRPPALHLTPPESPDMPYVGVLEEIHAEFQVHARRVRPA